MKKSSLGALVLTALIAGCGDEKDDNGQGGGGSETEGIAYGEINISSSTLAIDDSQSLSLQDSSLEDCFVQMDIYNASGSCLTPLAMVGFARLVEATDSSNTSPDANGRIAAVVEDVEGEEGALIYGNEFNLATDQTFVAYNELYSQYDTQTTYDYVTMGVDYQKTTFKVNDSYVTMFVAAFTQPLSEWDIWDSCGLSEEEKTYSRFDDLDELAGMSFERGDYLFCVKDSLDASCSAEDYKWLDTDTNELVETRPTNPRVHQYLVNDEATCSMEEQEQEEGRGGEADVYTSASFTPMILAAKLDTPFKLYADFSHGINSSQWPEEFGPFGNDPDPQYSGEDGFETPYLLYYFQEEGDASLTEGTNLDIDFDFNVTQSMFIESMSEDELESAELGEILANVYTKHNWVFQKKAEGNVEGYSVDHFSSLSVATEISIAGGRERPPEPED